MSENQIVYYVALGMIPGVGNIIAKNLVAYVGSAEGVFRESNKNLQKIPKVGPVVAEAICSFNTMDRAFKEIDYIKKHNVNAYIYSSENYPFRLKECDDAPVVLFVKGDCDLNARKAVSIVGTRNATTYGKEMCKELVTKLIPHNPIVVSGMALGIDASAHKAALDAGLQTVAVLGTSLDTIYPAEHKFLSAEIEKQGALVTELCHGTPTDKSHFVKRNRIIAGLTDVTVVVESGIKGGALITVEYANAYNREVMAFPGRSTDKYSQGCNAIIKRNKAALIETVEDLEYVLNWQLASTSKQPKQTVLHVDMSEDEERILEALKNESMLNIDIISVRVNLPVSKVSTLLLGLEFNGLVRCYPGKLFSRI